MQIHQHCLFQLGLAVIDSNRVIVAVQSMNQCLDRRLVNVSDVGCCLPWLPTRKYSLGVDETEGINDYLAFHRLDGINDHRNAAVLHLFK